MSQSIVETIRRLPDLYTTGGCTAEEVQQAQERLGLTFPRPFVDYVRTFGTISFYGTEWCGLHVTGYLNVVSATLEARSLYPHFPGGFFVLEDLRMDGKQIIVNGLGQVYALDPRSATYLFETMEQYLECCIRRGNARN